MWPTSRPTSARRHRCPWPAPRCRTVDRRPGRRPRCPVPAALGPARWGQTRRIRLRRELPEPGRRAARRGPAARRAAQPSRAGCSTPVGYWCAVTWVPGRWARVGVAGLGVLGSGSLGSGLLPCDGDGEDSPEPADGEGLGVVEEPSRLSSTSPRPRVSEPCADGAVDAAADNPAAACEAGAPAVPASTAPSATAAAPLRRPRWRPVFVVDTLDLKINMVIEPSRNRPAGKTCKNREFPARNRRDRRGSGCLWNRCDSCD